MKLIHGNENHLFSKINNLTMESAVISKINTNDNNPTVCYHGFAFMKQSYNTALVTM